MVPNLTLPTFRLLAVPVSATLSVCERLRISIAAATAAIPEMLLHVQQDVEVDRDVPNTLTHLLRRLRAS